MSDDVKPEEPRPLLAFVKLWHPAGVQVNLPVEADPRQAKQKYAVLLGNVTAALEAGWLVQAPGLEAGEHREEIGWVVKKVKENDDRTETPVVDLYPVEGKFSVLSVYLNDDAAAAAFEAASGLRLRDMPTYEGTNKVERGASSQADRKVVKAPRPFGVVYVANPKYDEAAAEQARKGGGVYKVPRRKFVRWADQAPAAAPAEGHPAPADAPPFGPDPRRWWTDFSKADPPLDVFNSKLPDLAGLPADAKRYVWDQIIAPHAKAAEWEFDPKAKQFVRREPAAAGYTPRGDDPF